MICQYCGRNPAVIYIKAIANGRITEYALCAKCARELGYGNSFTEIEYDFEGILKEFFTEDEDTAAEVHCKCCGASFRDIARSGKAGCANCYFTFRDRLEPFMRQLHGNAVHLGKMPNGDLPQLNENRQLAVTHVKVRRASGGHYRKNSSSRKVKKPEEGK